MLASLLLSLGLGTLPPGTQVPDLVAPNQDGVPVHLSQFRGKRVLIYFYPKDDTPGCTRQAQELREDYPSFQELGVVILGVSRQDAASHRAFRAKHNLPFDLLTDQDGAFARALGVGLMPLLGLHKRQSVLLDEQGRVMRFFADVSPKKHSDEVLAFLRSLGPSK